MDKEGLIAPLRVAVVMSLLRYGVRALIFASWQKWVIGHGLKNNSLFSISFSPFFLLSRLGFWSHAWSLATPPTLRMSTSPASPTKPQAPHMGDHAVSRGATSRMGDHMVSHGKVMFSHVRNPHGNIFI